MEKIKNTESKCAEEHNHEEHTCGSCRHDGGCGCECGGACKCGNACGGGSGCGSHGMMCGGGYKGWHGRHSIVRILIAVLLLVGAFSLGVSCGEMKGDYRGERGYGYGMHRGMGGYGFSGDRDFQDMQAMMLYHQLLSGRATLIPVVSSTTEK